MGHLRPHFTDKLPSNFLDIGFICQALPQARILHMVRDPVGTSFSNLGDLFSSANAWQGGVDVLDLPAQTFGRGRASHWVC